MRIAAAGDIHCCRERRDEVTRALVEIDRSADLVLLCGDLTIDGVPEQGELLAQACASVKAPVFAVLGNHDWHANRRDELVAVLEAGGIRVLERSSAVCEIRGVQVGIVGTKGFVGGFPGSHLPDFGEPLLREVYLETSREVEALQQGLRDIAQCPIRIVVLHYAPTEQTIEGESAGIWAFLGSDRLAAPIAEHEPDLVLHGHAHAGRFSGKIGGVPVYNVSIPVMGRDFWLFELDAQRPVHTPIH
jgi:Icc-related predicted phosphoesterase